MRTRRMTLLFLLLPLVARAQQSPPTGSPCSPTPSLKGTCFSDSEGHILYWIAREWNPARDGGGPVRYAPDTVGYPAVLQLQQKYNSWLREIEPRLTPLIAPPKKHVGYQDWVFPAPKIHIDRPQIRNDYDADRQYRKEQDKYMQDLMNSRGTPLHGIPPIPTMNYSMPPSRHGWHEASLTLSDGVKEDGALCVDVLRIPMFIAGTKALLAQEKAEMDCETSTDSFWIYGGEIGDDSVVLSDEMCGFGRRAKNPMYKRQQDLLEQRVAALAAAVDSAQRFDREVSKVGKDDLPGAYLRFEDMPAGMPDDLARLQRSIDDGLMQAERLAAEYRVEKERDDAYLKKRFESGRRGPLSSESPMRARNESMHSAASRAAAEILR